jgi:endoglucanase
MDSFTLLEALSAESGVSGHEQAIAESLRARLEALTDALRVDALGSVIATKRGVGFASEREPGAPTPSVMLACHMDEIGLMVTRIEEGGFLRFTTVGGWDPRIMLAQPVWVQGSRAEAPLPGIVGSRPPHVLGPEQRGKPVPVDELFVDVGLAEEAVRAAVRVGDVISTRRTPIRLAGGRVAGKAFDNRASVASLLLALDALGRREHGWDVHAVATVQEEIGLKGAMAASWGIAPTIGIAVDVSFAKQHGTGEVDFELGGGPLIGLGPNIHPAIHRSLVAAAGRLEMKIGIEPLPGASGTDAWTMQVARSGLPTGLVSIPLRYMHSSVETLALADVERVGRLLAEFIAGLDADFAKKLVDDLGGAEAKASDSGDSGSTARHTGAAQ